MAFFDIIDKLGIKFEDLKECGRKNMELPDIVKKICMEYDAWVVGSYVENKKSKDIDVIVHPKNWRNLLILIADKKFSITTYGGIRLDNSPPIDIWPCELSDFLIQMPRGKIARIWQPKTGLILVFCHIKNLLKKIMSTKNDVLFM